MWGLLSYESGSPAVRWAASQSLPFYLPSATTFLRLHYSNKYGFPTDGRRPAIFVSMDLPFTLNEEAGDFLCEYSSVCTGR